MNKMTQIEMEFDTPSWRDERNRRMAEWIPDPHALAFALMLSDVSEFFDDLVDRDKDLTDARITRLLFTVLVDLPMNPFFDAYKTQLTPLIELACNAWLDANTLEKQDGAGPDRAYVLRDLGIDVALQVIGLVRGREYLQNVSVAVRNFFLHETLAQYKDKLP